MNRLFKLQVVGPVALFLAVLAAEAAAYALAHFPSAGWLWYLNIEVFGQLQRSHEVLWGYLAIPGAQLFAVALPILLLALYGLVSQKKLVIALASNLSFVAAAFVVFIGQPAGHRSVQASLVTILSPQSDGLAMWSAVVGASLLSAIISHVLFVVAIRREA